jgi:hypothetical protein
MKVVWEKAKTRPAKVMPSAPIRANAKRLSAVQRRAAAPSRMPTIR